MNIKLCYQKDNKKIPDYVEKLKSLNLNPILDDDIIQFSGRSLSLMVYDQLRSRDPRNPQVVEFKKRLMQIQIEKIKNCDALLICNEFEMNDLPSNFLFELFTANSFNKPIFLLNHLSYGTLGSNEINALDIIYVNDENFNLIIEEIEKKIKESITSIIKNISSIVEKREIMMKKYKLKKL